MHLTHPERARSLTLAGLCRELIAFEKEIAAPQRYPKNWLFAADHGSAGARVRESAAKHGRASCRLREQVHLVSVRVLTVQLLT